MWITLNGAPLQPHRNINNGQCNNSGIIAVWFLAEIIKKKTIYLVGFDFFAQVPNTKNNDIYDFNTKRSPDYLKTWNQLVSLYPDADFIRVGPIPDYDKDFYEDLDMTCIEFEDFEKYA
jgi:hypothetical protein